MIGLLRSCGVILVIIGLLLFIFVIRGDKTNMKQIPNDGARIITGKDDEIPVVKPTVRREFPKSQEKPKTKLQTWTERIVGGLFAIPVVVAAVIGVISVCVKFVQICLTWIS